MADSLESADPDAKRTVLPGQVGTEGTICKMTPGSNDILLGGNPKCRKDLRILDDAGWSF
jgi:hypothetical protein